MRLLAHVFSLEIRSLMTYRADFWLGFLGTALGELAVAFFLWSSIFATREASEIGGWSFPAMMLYYSIVPLLSRMVRGNELGYISGEIYDGTLTRYLVWPVTVFPYKYAKSLAQTCVYGLQVVLALSLFVVIVGVPQDAVVTPLGIFGGLSAAIVGSLLYFLLSSSLELVAFWAENVWSLSVLLRFSTALLGGGLIPLTLYPEWAQGIIHWLPFEHLISLPARCIVGRATLDEWLFGLLMMAAWSLASGLACALIWSRGTRRYAGTGM